VLPVVSVQSLAALLATPMEGSQAGRGSDPSLDNWSAISLPSTASWPGTHIDPPPIPLSLRMWDHVSFNAKQVKFVYTAVI
jgi:hypothetical protein